MCLIFSFFLVQALIKGGHHTIIVIAHRLSTIRMADTIAVIQRGRVVEEGRHEELLQKNGHYSKLFAAQASVA